jgi:hypothetical protein
VGVPIGSPTQDYMYGGGTMYYDPGRQVLHQNYLERKFFSILILLLCFIATH